MRDCGSGFRREPGSDRSRRSTWIPASPDDGISSQLFDRDVLIGVDADVAGDLRAPSRRSSRGVQLGVLAAAPAPRRCAYGPPEPIATTPYSGSSTSPLPVMISEVVVVGDREHRLEPAQHAVGAPVLGQLDRRARQVAPVLLELGLEALEQRERVGRRAGEAGEHVAACRAGAPCARSPSRRCCRA